MRYINNVYKKNIFLRNVLTLSGGTAIVQLLGVILSPIITRLYSPEDLGILTIYTAVLGTLAVVGSLKYELGIPIADNDKKAINVLALSLLILLFYVAVIIIIMMIFGKWILEIVSGGVLSKYIYLIPMGILLIGTYNILSQWAFRKKDFITLTKTKINQSLAQHITVISLGYLAIGPLGLLLGQVLAQSTGITTLARPIIQKDDRLVMSVKIKEIIWCAKRYIKFPLYSSAGQFLNTFGLQLPIFFITALYGNGVVGLFGLANTIVNMPVNLIGKSIGSVFYGEAASVGKKNPEYLKNLSKKLFKKLVVIGLLPIAPIIFFGPYFFSLVFGDEWYQSGVYAQIISLLVYSRFIFLPASRVFEVFEKQKVALLIDILRVTMVLSIFLIAKFYLLSSYLAIGLYVLVMALIYLITFLTANRIIDNEIENRERLK